MKHEIAAALSKDEKQNEVLGGEHNKIMRLGRVISFLSRRRNSAVPLSMQDLERKHLVETTKMEAHSLLSAAPGAQPRAQELKRMDPTAAASVGLYQVDLAVVHAQTPSFSSKFGLSATAPSSPRRQRTEAPAARDREALADLFGDLHSSMPSPEDLVRRFTIRERAEEAGGSAAAAAAAAVAATGRRPQPGGRGMQRSLSQMLSLRTITALGFSEPSGGGDYQPMSLPSSPKVSSAQILAFPPPPDSPPAALRPLPPSPNPRPSEAPSSPPTVQPPPSKTSRPQPCLLQQLAAGSSSRSGDTRFSSLLPSPSEPQQPPGAPPAASPSLLSTSSPLTSPLSSPSPLLLSSAPSPTSQHATLPRPRPQTASQSLMLLLSSSNSVHPSPVTTPRTSFLGDKTGWSNESCLSPTTSASQRPPQLRLPASPTAPAQDLRQGTSPKTPMPTRPASGSMASAAQQPLHRPKASPTSPNLAARQPAPCAAPPTRAATASSSRARSVGRSRPTLPTISSPRVMELVFDL